MSQHDQQHQPPSHDDEPLPHDPGHVRTREHYERMAREAANQQQK